MTETGVSPNQGHSAVRELLERCLGQVVGRSVVVVERGPVTAFADAILDLDPVYRVPAQANAYGFTSLPAPPTFPVAMEHWGGFPELQPRSQGSNLVVTLVGRLLAEGGSILLAGQEFTYNRPVVVGDVLVGESRMIDGHMRRVMASTLTFLVIEATWTDRSSGDLVVTVRSTYVHHR
ncbi:MAG: FAS1-like dehydratase domain-containing protein [Acidimicrobiales bacterium]